MRHLNTVNSEGGPMLLMDARAARAWRGIEADGSDYERAGKVFEETPVPGGVLSLGEDQAIVWNMGGSGTAHVFVDTAEHLVILRAWLDNPHDLETLFEMAALPWSEAVPFATLDIPSGVLAVLWAPESGECIEDEDLDVVESKRPTGEMAIDSSGLLVSMPSGHYQCLHDEVHAARGNARRCHLLRR
jgi:hypothetical protein